MPAPLFHVNVGVEFCLKFFSSSSAELRSIRSQVMSKRQSNALRLVPIQAFAAFKHQSVLVSHCYTYYRLGGELQASF